MKAMGIKEEMAQDRCAWRNITGGPTRASADAWNTVCVLGSRTLNEYDDDDDVVIDLKDYTTRSSVFSILSHIIIIGGLKL